MDPQKWLDFLKQLIDTLFGSTYGPLILQIAAWLVFIYIIFWFVAKSKDLISSHFLPLFYKPKERRQAERRRRFAEHIESEIKRLNRLEEWSDYRFAEMEVEVEAEGDWAGWTFIPFLNWRKSGLRREKSLSDALAKSRERLILLQGDPGAGKSVALRHIALKMANRAGRRASLTSVIPIYINLKELHRKPKQKIERQLLQGFILQSLNRVNDRDIELFLEQEFEHGLREGRWLFLFDSFDELPDVLGSTHSDQVIRNYSDAISDFLHGMNRCRGIVASRHFRGPKHTDWPKFTILALTESRRQELIRRAELGKQAEELLIGGLATASDSLVTMSANPMFLGLLCDHMKAGNAFPGNSHTLFESYINTRLERDSVRIQTQFDLSPQYLRKVAEHVAFTMNAHEGLGLSPARTDLQAGMREQGYETGLELDRALDALVYIKLAKSETTLTLDAGKLFTFAHRRFQEYFATCVVLAEPKRVDAGKLLTDGRWRETAITLCYAQPAEKLAAVYAEADTIIENLLADHPNLIESRLDYVDEDSLGNFREAALLVDLPELFFHVIGILHEGLFQRAKELPVRLRKNVDRALLTLTVKGPLFEQKLALQTLGIGYPFIIRWILAKAFRGKSSALQGLAYQQLHKVTNLTPALRQRIVDSIAHSVLKQDRYKLQAYINRLPESENLNKLIFPLRFISLINFVIASVLATLYLLGTSAFILHSLSQFSKNIHVLTLLLVSTILSNPVLVFLQNDLSWVFLFGGILVAILSLYMFLQVKVNVFVYRRFSLGLNKNFENFIMKCLSTIKKNYRVFRLKNKSQISKALFITILKNFGQLLWYILTILLQFLLLPVIFSIGFAFIFLFLVLVGIANVKPIILFLKIWKKQAIWRDAREFFEILRNVSPIWATHITIFTREKKLIDPTQENFMLLKQFAVQLENYYQYYLNSLDNNIQLDNMMTYAEYFSVDEDKIIKFSEEFSLLLEQVQSSIKMPADSRNA